MAETLTVLHRCNIRPQVETAEKILPLLHFDMTFLFYARTQRLLFFEFTCSKLQFLESIIPTFKKSLAQSLTHFLPLVGKIYCPINSGLPYAKYVAGDSVSLTIAESGKDFDHFIGNHPRATDEFYDFVPELFPAMRVENDVVFPVLALQVTLFPERGICLGVTKDHGICDASSIARFIKLWASICKFGEINSDYLPMYDRTAVEYPAGLDSIYWEKMKALRPMKTMVTEFPTNKVRSTLVLTQHDIQRLKRVALTGPDQHVTSFTVTCALVWTSLVKAEEAAGEASADEDGDSEVFYFVADCRGRLRTPLQAEYFGNCLVYVTTELKRGTLKGEGGISAAAACIGAAIRRRFEGEKGVLDGIEEWPEEFMRQMVGRRGLGVLGTPRFDLYEVDYGWGGPRKIEQMAIDGFRQMSLCKSRAFEGGLEIGLSLKKVTMDAFATIFARALGRSL